MSATQQEHAPVAAAEAARPESLKLYTSPLLIMLMLAYTTNFMDRTIVATLAEAIKLDLKISDGELGLLQGFAFVVLYSVMGVPIARLSERRDRITIISVCMAIWSGLTMLCGTAQTYLQLLLFRIGVGVGEAGCNAPAHSMIADGFPAAQRARAIGIYSLGVPIGTMIGAVSGGLIAENLSWRAAFLIVGAPGFILAIILRLTAKEPVRVKPAGDQPQQQVAMMPLARKLATEPVLRNLVLGFMLASFSAAGLSGFTQPYFIRTFGLSYAQIGVVFGFGYGLFFGLSLIISSRLADKFSSKDIRWHAWLAAFGVAISTPFSFLGFIVAPWPLALAMIMLGHLFLNWYIAPTYSSIYKIVGARSVAMSIALVLMFQNLVGLGGGPWFTGVAIDWIAQYNFPLAQQGEFGVLCRGGVAAPGAEAALKSACATTLVGATRIGLLLAASVKLWAAWHFVLAARHMRAVLTSQPQLMSKPA